MGAWGAGAFENDEALDFVDEVLKGKDLLPVEKILKVVIETGDGYLELTEGAGALAASEIVARLLGRGEESSNEELEAWITSTKLVPTSQLVQQAQEATKRVMTAPSELLELWSESGDPTEWTSTVENLNARLTT